MKHSGEFPFDKALPDAPLDMPKQQLERHNGFLTTLRLTLSAITGR
jgi:hypothetical protein